MKKLVIFLAGLSLLTGLSFAAPLPEDDPFGIEKFEQVDGEKSVLTTFQYNGEGKIKSMNTSVVANGVETSVTTEFLVLRSSAKFPDRAFNF